MTSNIDPQVAISNLNRQLNEARSRFREWVDSDGEEWFEPAWITESCFIQLMAFAESLGLNELRNMVYAEYASTKKSRSGFSASGSDPDGMPYSIALARVSCFQHALATLFPPEENTTVTKDLLQIIRDIHYTITDTTIFQAAPSNEADVHNRIEAVLKCVFPDLKHKPTLTKQIKNFEPDTGIPSLKTLIEYKFLGRKEDVGVIADQVLADTRGYTSNDWSKFIYVIYETNRFRRESDWKIFLKESGVPHNTTIVVLNGEPAAIAKKYVQPRRKREAKKSNLTINSDRE